MKNLQRTIGVLLKHKQLYSTPTVLLLAYRLLFLGELALEGLDKAISDLTTFLCFL